jgi:hypothetical protein
MLHCVKGFCCTAAKTPAGIKGGGAGVETKLFSPRGRRANLTESKAFAE